MRTTALVLAVATVGLSGSLCLAAPQYEPVAVELRGQTKTWTETGSVLETQDDATYLTERYGERFSYALSGLPEGPARLKLGFCELRYDQPGQRVFDIMANGKALFEDFDILQWGDPREAVVVSRPVDIPEGGLLDLEFIAKVDNAKVNLLKIYTQNWILQIGAADGPQLLLGESSRNASYMHEAYETCISKFGSRICINPRPQKAMCRQTPLGHADYNVAYFEQNPDLYRVPPTAVYYAVNCRTDDGPVWYSLPFNGRIAPFTQIKQEQTLTSLSYTCRGPDLPVEVTYSFHAPFYPGDVKLSVAPYILLDVTVRNLTSDRQHGSAVVGQSLRPTDTTRKALGRNCIGVLQKVEVFRKSTQQAWLVDIADAEGVTAHSGTLAIPAPEGATGTGELDGDGRTRLTPAWADTASGLTWDFNLTPRAQAKQTFVYAGWLSEPIIEVLDEPYRFKYTELFKDIFDVARFALDNRRQIDAKVALFESTVYDASGSDELKQFLAFAFQSWMQNTFYCVNDDDEDWFSVWEGCCKFHSTVDVEYNVAPLYFEYWPELMKMTLREWVSFIRDGVLSHDMGMGLEANGMKYGHDMEVEENTNYVLLLYHYWRQTGDGELVKELFEHVESLLQHVVACDTDQDGFHETGTYNTIDQGSAAVQYAKDQTYLATRAMCAFECGAQMAEHVGREALAGPWREQAQLTAVTLAQEAWLDDHYVVSLNQPPPQQPAPTYGGEPDDRPEGIRMRGEDPENWTAWNQPGYGDYQGYSTPASYKPVSGWDAYSIYATNGMLYPMRSGCELPGIDLERMRTDLQTSAITTLQEFGSPHTDRENNMWVSQNIWRDMAAAYLGIDITDNIERYWNLQKYINRDKRGTFTDVYVYGSDHISLDYYPRGTAAFGLLPAMAGLQVDKVTGRVSVAPVRAPLRIPLLAYADWQAGSVPWLTIAADGAQAKVRVEGELPVEVGTRQPGSPW